MVMSHPRPPLLPLLLLLKCALEPPTTRAETRTRTSQVHSALANHSSTAVRHTQAVRRQHCRGNLRLFRKMIVYLLPACPITQQKLPLLIARGLLRRPLQILTSQCRRREHTARPRFPSARTRLRRQKYALRVPFSSAMVRVRRREPVLAAPFPSAAA